MIIIGIRTVEFLRFIVDYGTHGPDQRSPTTAHTSRSNWPEERQFDARARSDRRWALLITDGVISNVGPSRRIENLAGARSAEEINASGRVVMPGFVDSHTHLIAASPRVSEYRTAGVSDSTLGRKAMQFNIEYVRRSSASALEHQAKKLLQGFLRHGTTTVEVKSGYGLDETGELKILRAISHLSQAGINVASTFMAPHTAAAEFSGSPNAHVEWIRDHLLPKVKQKKVLSSPIFIAIRRVSIWRRLTNSCLRPGGSDLQSSFTLRTQHAWARCVWASKWAP